MSAVAIAAVVAAGATAYGAYASSKSSSDAKKAASANAGAQGQFNPLKLGPMPDYIPNNAVALNGAASNFDQQYYNASDVDFHQRHAPIVSAEKLFQNQVLKDQTGNTELMPQLQNEFQTAGLQGALSAFGDTPNTLAPGSAGEADVARNLGINILNFQQMNRANRLQSLTTAEQIFPRRTFGLSGQDAAQIAINNTSGQNNWNQANYANQTQLAEFNAAGQAGFNNAQTAQGNVNAAAAAQSGAASNQAILSSAQLIAKLGAQYAGSKPVTPAVQSLGYIPA